MKKFGFLLVCAFIMSSAYAQTKTTITRQVVRYEVKNMGITTEGKFSDLQADIKFTPAQLATSSIEASIDANSINTENTKRDEHLRSEKFFDVAHYAAITLKSVSFQQKSGNNFKSKFNLTIKGKTKAVDVTFTYTETGNTASFKGSFKINRNDFNVGGSSMVLSDEVTVFIEADITK
ncbi:YceI family protein [Mucilaginibacter gynuensis]|uniref:YceI family protein n=1 Tax=Mucilaginibacter gynuensis TaxID=1302236 RepID=A0ABP8H0B3_9SPHI